MSVTQTSGDGYGLYNTTDETAVPAAATAPDIDPASWLAGWRLGCIAREHLRNKA